MTCVNNRKSTLFCFLRNNIVFLSYQNVRICSEKVAFAGNFAFGGQLDIKSRQFTTTVFTSSLAIVAAVFGADTLGAFSLPTVAAVFGSDTFRDNRAFSFVSSVLLVVQPMQTSVVGLFKS